MDISVYQKQMDKAIDFLEQEFKAIQVWRASGGLVENISVQVSYWFMKIPQVSHVSIMDNQTLKIEPRDKWEIKNIEKAIYDANIWLTPKNEWQYIIVKIPALTQERRQEIVKQVKWIWEETKARVRVIRQDWQKETKKIFTDKLIWEDENKRNEAELDKITKNSNTKIDDLVKSKSDEVMKI